MPLPCISLSSGASCSYPYASSAAAWRLTAPAAAASCKPVEASPCAHGRLRRRVSAVAWRVRRRRKAQFCSFAASSSAAQPQGSSSLGEKPAAKEEERQESEAPSALRVAGIVGVATLTSKLLGDEIYERLVVRCMQGTVREVALAAAFGVGPVAEALSYATMLPGFFLALLGGINGPFHSAMVAALSKRNKQEGARLVESVTTLVALSMLVFTIAIAVFAGPLIDLSAPGLRVSASANWQLTQAIAIMQLRILAPCAVLAGLIGVGFGTLSANGVYAIPSLCPSLSSLSVLAATASYLVFFGKDSTSLSPSLAMKGGVLIAIGLLTGAVLQYLVQAAVQYKKGMGVMRFRWPSLKDPGVNEVIGVMVPGSVAAGMMQIATYTDLYFASFLPRAAAALGYANILVQAPLGILSSALLVPILPVFARLSQPHQWPQLKQKIRQAFIVSLVATLPLTATLIPLSKPIVNVLFERKAFDAGASALVSSLLCCYASGAGFYLARDVAVRVFYALGDGTPPFVISSLAIIGNAFLDWLFVRHFNFGAQGLIFATTAMNAASVLALLVLISRRLGGLEFKTWIRPLVTLLSAAVCASAATGITFQALQSLQLHSWFARVFAVGLAGVTGLAVFVATVVVARLPEATSVMQSVRQRLAPAA
eukprot:jgi/Chlat1/2924/Chrsp2S04634